MAVKFNVQKLTAEYFTTWTQLLAENKENVAKIASLAAGPLKLINTETLTPIEKRILLLLLPIDVDSEDKITNDVIRRYSRALVAGFISDPINMQFIIDSYPVKQFSINTNQNLPTKVRDFLLSFAATNGIEVNDSNASDIVEKMLQIVSNVHDFYTAIATKEDVKKFLDEYNKQSNRADRKKIVDEYSSKIQLPKYILNNSKVRKSIATILELLDYIDANVDPYKPLSYFTGLSEEELKQAAAENREIEVTEGAPLIDLINAMLENNLDKMDSIIENIAIKSIYDSSSTAVEDDE